MKLKIAALLLFGLFGLSACGEPEPTSQEENEENNEVPRTGTVYENDSDAELCVVERGDYDSLTAESVSLDETSELEMVVGLFLLSHAGQGPLLEQYCSVELNDDTLIVESRIAFGPSTPSQGDSTVNDERFMACDVPSLATGTYQVVHGDSTYTLTIPSETNLDCGASLFNSFYLLDE